MPLQNCPQSFSWCPHFHPDMCRDVKEGEHDVCIHARAAIGSMAAAKLATMAALVTNSSLVESREFDSRAMRVVNEEIASLLDTERRSGN